MPAIVADTILVVLPNARRGGTCHVGTVEEEEKKVKAGGVRS